MYMLRFILFLFVFLTENNIVENKNVVRVYSIYKERFTKTRQYTVQLFHSVQNQAEKPQYICKQGVPLIVN